MKSSTRSFQDLEVWRESMLLVKDIYVVLRTFPKDELFVLVSQIKRSSISVPSNIAEGVSRPFKKEAIYFLNVAKGSLNELDCQIQISSMVGYIKNEELNQMLSKIETIKKLLNGLIRHYHYDSTLK